MIHRSVDTCGQPLDDLKLDDVVDVEAFVVVQHSSQQVMTLSAFDHAEFDR